MRDAITVDTHTGAHKTFSWLLEGWFTMMRVTDSLSCDYQTLLVIGGIDTLASHVMRDTIPVDTHIKAHVSFSLPIEDLMDEFYDNYDQDCSLSI